MASGRENLFNSCIKELHSSIDYVQQYFNDKQLQQQFEQLRKTAKEYSEIEIQYERTQKALEATNKYFDDEQNDCTKNVQQVYKTYLDEQPNDVTYESHSVWCKVVDLINGQNSTEENKMSSSEEVSEDEIEDDNRSVYEDIIPSQFEPPVDPITKQIITNPCRNKKCNHVYEYETVMDHLNNMKQRKIKPRCPYIGCTNTNMNRNVIVKDRALMLQIQYYIDNVNTEPETSATASFIN